MRSRRGLSVVETLIAITVLGVVTAAAMTTYASSMRHNADAGKRTQSAQLLNYLGRRVAGGDGGVLPGEAPRAWGYGELLTAFPELNASAQGFADPQFYRASVSNLGPVSLGAASATHYRIEVCTRASGDERCLRGDTLGPTPSSGSSTPALPGIN
jgi:type II secretory pathway pseudopilin PulG